MIVRLPPFAPGQTIGLLGGSFNPPHEGHRLISELALRRLRLDRLWWLATPGNPLKPSAGLAEMRARIEAARELNARSAHRRHRVRGGDRGALHLRNHRLAQAPGAGRAFRLDHGRRQFERNFTFGGTGARSPTSCRSWSSTVRDRRCGRSPAAPAAVLARWRRPESEAARFARLPPPAFLFLHGPRSGASSTALRQAVLQRRRPS